MDVPCGRKGTDKIRIGRYIENTWGRRRGLHLLGASHPGHRGRVCRRLRQTGLPRERLLWETGMPWVLLGVWQTLQVVANRRPQSGHGGCRGTCEVCQASCLGSRGASQPPGVQRPSCCLFCPRPRSHVYVVNVEVIVRVTCPVLCSPHKKLLVKPRTCVRSPTGT